MEIVELNNRRHASRLMKLEDVRDAQRKLEPSRQREGALELLRRIDAPSSEPEAIELVDALGFAVDAYCNERKTVEACSLASEKIDLVYDLDPNRRRRLGRGPRTLPAFRAARIQAEAIELNGDPDDAIRRLTALQLKLSRAPEIEAPVLDSVRISRAILSSAKRDGSRTARHFADLARRQGDGVVENLDTSNPAVAVVAASYWHRAAIERRARGGRSAQEEVIELFERSLPLRSNIPRDLQTRGMAIGDLCALRGDREKGARILTATVEGFEDVLPRHYESALEQLIERDLWRAA
jgi:hypothetical protein